LAEANQKRKGIWSTKKQIAADLLNRFPRLREARIAVLIYNGESHVTFQDHGLSTATRGRLSIPHGNRLWTGFLSRGKIVHIASHPEKSELLRRWFGPEDFKGITQVAFIPVASRQDGSSSRAWPPAMIRPCQRSGECCRGRGRTPVTEDDLRRIAAPGHRPGR
jgi:hypothetical protein